MGWGWTLRRLPGVPLSSQHAPTCFHRPKRQCEVRENPNLPNAKKANHRQMSFFFLQVLTQHQLHTTPVVFLFFFYKVYLTVEIERDRRELLTMLMMFVMLL